MSMLSDRSSNSPDNKSTKKVITNVLRRLRFDRNEMTQQALADAVNVSRQTIVAIEKGKYSPSLEVAFKVADVFSVTISDVFQYQNEEVDDE